MCGIAGYIGTEPNAAKFLLDALKKLEYRGYDSAGMALLCPNLEIIKVDSRVDALAEKVKLKKLTASVGIAHTRWATHGKPSINNAHPHVSNNRFAIVHNGIIENFQSLKAELIKENYVFNSETDSEVIAHLIHFHFNKTNDLVTAFNACLAQLEGAFAVAVCDQENPNQLIVSRKASPLIIGSTQCANLIASDLLALSGIADKVAYLEDGDVAVLKRDEVVILNQLGEMVVREFEQVTISANVHDKNGYDHYMLKEIHEQEVTVQDTYRGCFDDKGIVEDCFGRFLPSVLDKIEVIQIIACGTSYHAGLIAKSWIEAICGKLCLVDIASEFRYRTIVLPQNTLVVAISQSGETADTLSALEFAKSQHVLGTMAICNVPTSTLVRETDGSFLTKAGPEIGVASTKAFSTQLVALYLLAVYLQRHLPRELVQSLLTDLKSLPNLVKKVFELEPQVKKIAQSLQSAQSALFLGRGLLYPIALEGALKLKEISYIHAEAYPAGELKHGPLALVDENMPVIVVAPDDELVEKLKSNLQEVLARGGQLFVFSERVLLDDERVKHIIIPKVAKSIAPFIYNIPLQLLSYYTALACGEDIDKPRNLAKSVTVE